MSSVIVTLVGLAGCGSSSPGTVALPTTSTSTTTSTATTTTRAPTTSRATTSTRPPVTGNWVPIATNLVGLPSECGNITLVSARPDRDMLTVSVALRGLWASTNGASEWTPLGQGAGSASIVNRASSIVYDPVRPNTFWESGIYNGGGVYRTDDNGVTFRQLGEVRHSDAVSVDLTDPQRLTLLSGTHESSAVFVSRDGGRAWSDISGSLPKDVGFSSQPLILDSRTYLLGTTDGPGSGVFRTVDSGSSWQTVHKGSVKGRPLVATSDGAIYWVTATGGIIKSVDQGVNWTVAASAGIVHTYAPDLVELPDGQLAAAGRSVVVSSDRGKTWRAVGPTFPIQPTGFAYSPFRNAFYIWYFTCENGPNLVPPNAILRLDFDYRTQ